MIFYINGKKYGDNGVAVKGSYGTDAQTQWTIGKPNYGLKYFGRFQMNSLVVYYSVLSKTDIENFYKACK